MSYLKTTYGQTYYERKGKKNLPVLLIVHGGPGGNSIYLENYKELAKKFHVVLYDQVGTGRSDRIPRKNWKVTDHVKQLSELIKGLELKNINILSHSWGAVIALEYLKKYGQDNIESFIFTSPLISTDVWLKDANKLIKKMSKKDQKIIKACEDIGATDSKVYQQCVERFTAKHILTKNQNSPFVAKYGKKINAEMYEYMWGNSEFSCTGTLAGYDGLNLLKKIKKPAAFIRGKKDEVSLNSCQRFSRLVNESKVIEVTGSSHCHIIENKKGTLKAVENFLLNLGGRR